MIAEKYGVSVEAIMKFNNLEGRKLSPRQKLQIPAPEDIAQIEETTTEEDRAETQVTEAADSTAVTENAAVEEDDLGNVKNDFRAVALDDFHVLLLLV